MDSVVKKTGELSDAEIESINTLFFEVFGLQRDILTVREECFNAPLGYSVHSLMYDKGLLVAYYVYMPFYYKKKGEKFIFPYRKIQFVQDYLVSKAFGDVN